MTKPTVIFVAGPTASGKTSTAISLAKTLNTEIISFDSRQFYRELEIGAAPPSKSQLQEVKHHFIGNLSVAEDYSVAKFQTDAFRLIQHFPEKKYWIAVGGSGLYMRALTDGLDKMPEITAEVRQEVHDLYRDGGLERLQEYVRIHDPEYLKIVDQQNHRRLMRAVEIHLSTGLTYTDFRKGAKMELPYRVIKLILDLPRNVLYNNINSRTDEMIKAGWLEECKSLLPYSSHNALQTVGYKEMFSYLRSESTWERTVELIKQNTRRYAKRQLTWFRKEENTVWMSPTEIAELNEDKIASLLSSHA